ncbi:NUDIX domain-containing protein [Erythrobacter mangrovi]|uniref:NUDIX domain-containing protein n=1 Tax=Erythrobacter mangrovi TaxID=2739433 RepID=UPI002277D977|nr:NUDIX domain-containing protein [Erythrobacter mangrovi]
MALALCGGDGRWLMHRRPQNKHHGGLWEFPGGKVEIGENPSLALVREIKEELGLQLTLEELEPVGFAQEPPNATTAQLVILLYKASWSGAPIEALEGGAIGWFSPAELVAIDMPPLDIALARGLFEKALD